MEKIKLINRKPLTSTEKIVIAIHILASVGMWISYEQHLLPIDTLKDVVNMYFFMIPMLLVGIFFRNLRNFNFYVIWVFIGIAQLVVYPELIRMSEFEFFRGSAFSGLRALLPTVLMFQLLRIVFIKTHNMEMIISIRQYRMSRWEEEENRNMTWLEVAFSITILLTVIFSNLYE